MGFINAMKWSKWSMAAIGIDQLWGQKSPLCGRIGWRMNSPYMLAHEFAIVHWN